MSSSEMSEWSSEDDAPVLTRPVFKSKTEEVEWERKQRNREYRVAARREKRNRKADEKKQRKLNATILRRMTKNPEKYNKNVDRNRGREVVLERRKIYREAIAQAERLAAIYDPSGRKFNVGPVIVQEDGSVVSVEFLERRARARAERAAKLDQDNSSEKKCSQELTNSEGGSIAIGFHKNITGSAQNSVNPARRQLIQDPEGNDGKARRLSKNQQKKLALLEERPAPPKPIIPEGIDIPDDEENWLALWEISDEELERRVVLEKKCKAAERKALREKQKEGKSERRAARDERRRVYREKKLEWRTIKEAEKQQKKKLLRVEQEEAKRIEVEVNLAERRRTMEICAELGFTLGNVEGVDDIKPKALGMKGQEVDFNLLEIGNRPSDLKIKDEKILKNVKDNATKGARVDLGKVVDESKAKTLKSDGTAPADTGGDFVSLDFAGTTGDWQEFGALNYNHKVRRKLHRAIEAAQIQKELLVRAKARAHCESTGIEVPVELAVEYKPIKLSGRRILEDGSVETEKQERVRKRLELAEYNKAAKVLRQQAKAEAIEAGLRIFAELTGKKTSSLLETGPRRDEDQALQNCTHSETTGRANMSNHQNPRKRQRDHDDLGLKEAGPAEVCEKGGREAGSVMNKAKKQKTTKSMKIQVSDGAVVSGDVTTSPLTTFEATSRKRKSSNGQEENIDGRRNDVKDGDGDSALAHKEKRRLRRLLKQQKASSSLLEDATQDREKTSEPTPKKLKKTKRETASIKDVDASGAWKGEKQPREKVEVNRRGSDSVTAVQWNPDALGGNSARKNKFLRLLGASKVNGTDKSVKMGKSTYVDLSKIDSELERQFAAGVRMKHGGQKKRGLGA